MLYVLSGHPTNYGLLEKLQQKWKKEAAMENLGIHLSTYNLSYNRHPRASFTLQHYAPSKSLSCHFHPHRVNKDLHLRGKQLNTAPEFPPTLAIPHNVPPDFPQSTILAVWSLCCLRTLAYNKHASTALCSKIQYWLLAFAHHHPVAKFWRQKLMYNVISALKHNLLTWTWTLW